MLFGLKLCLFQISPWWIGQFYADPDPCFSQTHKDLFAKYCLSTLTKISCWYIHLLLHRIRRFRAWRKRCATTRTRLPRSGRTSRISPTKRIDSPRIWRNSAPSTRNSKVRHYKYLVLHSVLDLYPVRELPNSDYFGPADPLLDLGRAKKCLTKN